MIQISDTTLRDGAQAEGISFSLDDKLQILKELDDLGVSWIEGGNPASNPLDRAFFEAVASLPRLRHAKIAAFGSTCRPHTAAGEDEALEILAGTQADLKTVFGKSSRSQVSLVLRCSPEENLRMIEDSVRFSEGAARLSGMTRSISLTLSRRIRTMRFRRSPPRRPQALSGSFSVIQTAAPCPPMFPPRYPMSVSGSASLSAFTATMTAVWL